MFNVFCCGPQEGPLLLLQKLMGIQINTLDQLKAMRDGASGEKNEFLSILKPFEDVTCRAKVT
jgi:hypothetical protein